VSEDWSYGGAPQQSGVGTVTLVEGVTFCICGRAGDIRVGAEQGFFFRDTRFLSRFEIAVDGQRLDPLAARSPEPYSGTFVARRPPRDGTADSTLLVVRRRHVGDGMLDEITVRNLGREPAGVLLTIAVEADFASLFAVKEGRARAPHAVDRDVADGELRLHHRIGGASRAVVLRTGGPTAATITRAQIGWRLVVPERGETTVAVQVVPVIDGVETPPRHRPGEPVHASESAQRLARWKRATPAVSTPDTRLSALVAASAEDLGVLRMFDPDHPDTVVVAAGAPWFMALFGRDSLLTSWMLLPVDPGVALGTLQTLARLQGRRVDPLSEEQPGRILHEMRSAPSTQLALGGGNVYYGTVDATPLFVMLLGECRRWGIAESAVDDLLPHVDRAMEWIETYGDRDGDGFVEYQRATDRGLLNQGWKDSFDAIAFAGGAIAEPPIALAEVQGYVYAAYLARSYFAKEAGDEVAARRWATSARDLKAHFNAAFWLPDKGYFALALDAHKRPVDALASNMGHCLWTGIVDEDKAASVAEHLLGPQMFTGFGVRTLATSMAAYNPVSYHNGSVWPHDNALIAAGLMRYGFVEAAQRIAMGLIDAAAGLGGRLPELFCGFDRTEFETPVPYPTSCSPQAWASASVLSLLRTLLRLDPWVPFGRVWAEPAVPDPLLPLRIDRLHLAGRPTTVVVDRGHWEIEGLPRTIEVVRGPRRPITEILSDDGTGTSAKGA
jgi:glycogen debranching enzyme